jgi:hypothetical protein
VASAASLGLNMWIGRGLTFSTDELVWFMLSPDLDVSGAFHPYVGHLIVTSKVLYKLIFETIGPEYWPIRLLAALTLIAVVWVLYRLMRRWCGDWPALAIALVVLFFSGDPAHVFHGNGITVLGSVGCGLFALLMLSEEKRSRSILACLALCLGVATYSQALPFLIGATVFLLAAKRRRDLWVPAVPFFLYLVWWVWARSFPGSTEHGVEPERIYMLPAWGFRATGAVVENVLRLPHELGGDIRTVIGLLVAAGLFGFLGWSLKKGRANPLFFAGAATLVTMWALVIIVPTVDRDFDSSRYMYPFLLASVVTWGSLIRVEKPDRRLVWAAVVVVTVLCLLGIREQEKNNDAQRSGVTIVLRSGLAGVEAVRPTDPNLTADDLATEEEDFFLNLPFRAMDDLEIPSLAAYTTAVEEYGTVGFTPAEIHEKGRKAEYLADRSAYRISGIGTTGVRPEGAKDLPCKRPTFLFPGDGGVKVPPGTFEVRNPTAKPATLFIARFSRNGIKAGQVPPQAAALLGSPDNRGDADLRLKTDSVTLTVCR